MDNCRSPRDKQGDAQRSRPEIEVSCPQCTQNLTPLSSFLQLRTKVCFASVCHVSIACSQKVGSYLWRQCCWTGDCVLAEPVRLQDDDCGKMAWVETWWSEYRYSTLWCEFIARFVVLHVLTSYQLEAIRRMNLEGELQARFTGEKGTTLTDKNNKIYMQLPVGNGPTNETEILRGDFAEMLYAQTKDETEWIFGDSIVSVEDQAGAGKVKVGYASGNQAVFDYVVIADGARSRTRKIVFGESGFEYRPIGACEFCHTSQLIQKVNTIDPDIAYFSIPLEDSTPYSDQWHIIPLPRKRMIYFRPDFKANTSRAGIMFMAPKSLGYEKLSPEQQKATIAELYADGGENAERMIKGLAESNDLYFEYLGQVHAPSWSAESGRVLMVGDAAWCGTPVIGMGTSLSCAGAYVLAGEMARHMDDPKAAAKAYDNVMRPIVTEAQKIMPGAPGIFFQQSEWGVRTFCYIASAVGVFSGNKVIQRIFGAAWKVWERLSPSVESRQLPEYGNDVSNSKSRRE